MIEVAVSSEALDREKAGVYAIAGVTEYWLILPHLKKAECYSGPSPAGYGRRVVAQSGDMLKAIAVPKIEISADELFAAS